MSVKPLMIAALGLTLSGYVAAAGPGVRQTGLASASQSPLVNSDSVFTLVRGGHGGGGHGGAGTTGGPGYVTLDDPSCCGPSEPSYQRPAHSRHYRSHRHRRR
jgi:hypothetical protein